MQINYQNARSDRVRSYILTIPLSSFGDRFISLYLHISTYATRTWSSTELSGSFFWYSWKISEIIRRLLYGNQTTSREVSRSSTLYRISLHTGQVQTSNWQSEVSTEKASIAKRRTGGVFQPSLYDQSASPT
jgi:hypothetical protein